MSLGSSRIVCIVLTAFLGVACLRTSAASPATPATTPLSGEHSGGQEPGHTEANSLGSEKTPPSVSSAAPGGAKPLTSSAPISPKRHPAPAREPATTAQDFNQKPHPFQAPIPELTTLLKGQAMVYANWSPSHCLRQLQLELRKKPKGMEVKRHRGAAKGIATPLRIISPIEGVSFRAPPKSSVFGLLDCRLLFALRDMAAVAKEHGVKVIRIDNFYRSRARLAGKRKPSQHAYGLAADIVSFTLEDGRELDVEEDWHGSIGSPTCGPEAHLIPESESALLLRNLVCHIARLGLFHHVLTPNFNSAHKDHLHVDIKRDNKWFSVD